MKPVKAMLRFRCPYPQHTELKTVKMYDGEILLPIWSKASSTESRIICDEKDPIVDFDIVEYE